MNLQALLDERILGQSHASAAVAQRVRTARANLDDPNKPKGVFLFVGTSGVGKTETALALADLLYGGERKLITINMSEYQEAHSVSGLKGSPPGYVGYGEGGVLTEAVRRNPYSVVLLDEVEKAHPDVIYVFLFGMQCYLARRFSFRPGICGANHQRQMGALRPASRQLALFGHSPGGGVPSWCGAGLRYARSSSCGATRFSSAWG